MTEAEWLACADPQPLLEFLRRKATNADLIEHCRSGRQHARGCWVLDLLLGKS